MAEIMIAVADRAADTPACWDADLPAADVEPAGENRRIGKVHARSGIGAVLVNIEALQSLALIWTAADGAAADPMLTAEVAA
ncbi:hypothetical protein [Nocardia sp. NPDC059229]|uniref:hypothetical protein n=1 Tax=Nocardia sp. NPDC059229 TaxID=3346778 RepID=UPI00368D6EFA